MTSEDDDLDADLRALFADQRLSVAPGEDAVSSVLAGAKRRRRRRTAVLATGGALGVAAVLLAGGLIAGHAIRPGQVQSANPSGLPTSSYQTLAPTPAPAAAVLGPDGYGDLTLGMSAQQALATELVTNRVRTVKDCTIYDDTRPAPSGPAPTAQVNKSLYIYVSGSAPTGVQVIVAPAGVTTPEGIGVGSSSAAVKSTYPTGSSQRGGLVVVAVPGHTDADYRFTVDSQGTVTTVGLSVARQHCVD
ncbi:MAG TPA: hypothetical protein VG247_09995 [Pseudonocardiaceae bacterium]|nr:hypothetical protein [Pseudonocardiaceae bacterium]